MAMRWREKNSRKKNRMPSEPVEYNDACGPLEDREKSRGLRTEKEESPAEPAGDVVCINAGRSGKWWALVAGAAVVDAAGVLEAEHNGVVDRPLDSHYYPRESNPDYGTPQAPIISQCSDKAGADRTAPWSMVLPPSWALVGGLLEANSVTGPAAHEKVVKHRQVKVFVCLRLEDTPVASMGAVLVNKDEIPTNCALAEDLAQLQSSKATPGALVGQTEKESLVRRTPVV
ncbi:hypothetical protein FA13DRAFT_1711592 [Coprinellus micaceus]|uniref:Uncharacterized protein n=1 Tax=Coprinellus micaceus TaxID=71717 RepID=A0A4Y7T4G4_COPMI|nr:hypothetical protein FA13DRAFT_1711592 [Coprinellus micaceus]